jgi:hypothetical protein
MLYYIAAVLIFIVSVFPVNADEQVLSIVSVLQSDRYEDHLACIREIMKDNLSLKGESAVIELLFRELEFSIDNPLIGADANDYQYLHLLVIQILGRIGNSQAADRLVLRLFEAGNLVFVEQYISALADIGDDESYNVTNALAAYFSVFDFTLVGDNLDFCRSVMYSLKILAEPKPLDIIEITGLMDLIRIFSNDEIFSEIIVEESRKTFVSLLNSNL